MRPDLDADVVNDYEHDTWSRCAREYLGGFSGLTKPTLPLLVEVAEIQPGKRVLDLGSGPGHISEALTRAGATVTGIDFSGSMVEIARSRFPHISFRKANAEKIPFDENSFDVVVSNFVVHHLARPDAVFREVARVLKPEGRFAFTVFAAPEKQSSIGAFFQAVEANHSLEELPHGPLFGVTDLGLYSSMLREAGLLSPQFDFRSILWRTSSLDPVVESFRCWGNIELLPEEVQERIDAATRGNLQPYATDDGYALPHEVLLGSASAG